MQFLFIVVALISTYYVRDCVAHQPHLAPVVELNNGYKMPTVGLGTYPATGAECEQAVKDAIDRGYRHIDTAYLYGNEKEVGNAVREKIVEGVIRREDVFITTKLWNTFHNPKEVASAFQKSLENLNLGYIDLYLMHSPEAYQPVPKSGLNRPVQSVDDIELFPTDANGRSLTSNIDYIDTWRAMEQLLSTGLVHSIGVSNFEIPQIQRLESVAQIKPVVNQVECHPNKNQRKLIEYCSARNIVVTAYSPLGRGKATALSDPNVQQIANRHGKTAAQVVLRYTLQNGAAVIPKSTNKDRIAGNIALFDFELDANEMEYMHSLNKY